MSVAAQHSSSTQGFTQSFQWSGCLLGFAFGGFFDGILLHQVLQWHHLLSAVESEAVRDLRVQILADGLFHVVMYVVAAVGLWLLWAARREIAAPSSGRILLAGLLIGFGAWHVADAVLAHWMTGIHRIRMGTAHPLAWDLGWMFVFGIIPIAIGLSLRRNARPGTGLRGKATASLAAAVVLASGVTAAMPPSDSSQVIVFFRPGSTPANVFAAAAAVDGRVIWSDRSGQLWAFDVPDSGRSWLLYRHGALFVSNAFISAGCLSWSRA